MNLHQPTAHSSEHASLRRLARPRRFPFATSPSAYIPAAEQHGGLGMADVGSDSIAPVVAVLDPYKPYKSGDLVLLLWDGEQIASRSMTPADDDLPISLPIERADLRRFGDGEHRLVARFVPVLGDPQDSPPYPCFVKTARPGGIDTDPATETINENLALPTLRPMPVTDDLDSVRIVLRRYDNIAVGDLIYGSWHGRVLPVPPATPTPLTAADLGKAEFEIPVPRAVVEDVGGGDILVRYRILDRVANSSLWSPGLGYKVPIDDPGAPQSPWVEGTRNDLGEVLVLKDLGNKEVTVIVEAHTGMKDERIRVSWAGIANGQAVPVYQTDWKNVTRDAQTLPFGVPNAQAVILGEGSVTVTYELERLDGSTITSRRRVLAIEGKASTLLPPLVLDTPGDVLDAAAHKGGATLVAPHQPERIPAGSFVRFQWRGLAEGSTEETADGVKPTQGVMTYPQILALVGSTVTLNYRAETFGAASRLRRRPIAHPFAFDESRNLVLNVIDSEGAQPGLLPPPSIREAMGNVLDPDIALAHMDIPALTRGDRVTAHIDAKTPFLQTIPMGDPSRPPSFQLTQDNFIRANANTEASAWYLVTGNDGYIASSGPYVFAIGHAQAELPAPTVDHAAGGTLNPIDAIDGAVVRVPADLTTNDTVVVHFGSYNSAAVKWSANLAVTIPYAEVEKAAGSTIQVHYTVNRTQTSKQLTLTVKELSDEPKYGVAYQVEDFEYFQDVIAANTTGRFRHFSVEAIGASIERRSFGIPPYLVDMVIMQSSLGDYKIKVTLNEPTHRLRVGVLYGIVTVHAADGRVLMEEERGNEGWVDFDASDGAMASYFVLRRQLTSGAHMMDNVMIGTGETWQPKAAPFTETFHDLPLGNHGPDATLPRWRIRSTDGPVSVIEAPGGMTGRTIAIQTRGRYDVHELIPRFAIRPRSGVTLRIRSREVFRYDTLVAFAYIDEITLQQRVVYKRVLLRPAGETVTFEGAGATEYIAYLAVRPVADDDSGLIYYDDIQFL